MIWSRDSRSLRRFLARVWDAVRSFLEIIGLIPERPSMDHEAQLARFRLYHVELRKLLSANHSFLETLAELDEKRRIGGFIDRDYIKRKVIRCISDVHSMVEALRTIGEGRYKSLVPAYQRIKEELLALFHNGGSEPRDGLVMDLMEIRATHGDLVGGKMANLGEAKNVLGLPAPDGFAVTTEAFKLLMEEAGLRSWMQDREVVQAFQGELDDTLKRIRAKILDTPLPGRLLAELESATQRLKARVGGEVRFAVRSSAVGEDSRVSFAGQHKSLLNVSEEGLVQSYLEVAASLFSPGAVHYRILHGIALESAEMAVGVLNMIQAISSGVVFSRDPAEPELDHVIIQAVHGLGVSLVEGRVSPEVWKVMWPPSPRAQVIRVPSKQAIRVIPETGSGIREEPMGEGEARAPALTEDDAIELAAWAKKLEAHFGCPQDIEFAKAEDGRLWLLQCRSLRLFPREETGPIEGHRIILTGGETACPGVASGRAVHMDETQDLELFPEGGILVAKRSSPRFVKVLPRARAIVTDSGSTTGHMASLAREAGVPALLNTLKATQLIPDGALITVDASRRVVYEGEISLEKPAPSPAEGRTVRLGARAEPGDLELLEKALSFLSTLNLTDPSSPEFSPEYARSFHDLARFIHEKSYEEMFGLGARLGDMRPVSYLLDVFLPIDLYILDLGGGLKGTPRGNKVRPDEIACVPLKALIRGMLHEKIPRFGPRVMDLGGFFSVIMRHATTAPENERSFQDPCYALISDYYLNYTARVGYHFSVLDTYCSPTPNKNYISFLFRGGAADFPRRTRRARAIAGVLRHYGFSVNLAQDAVHGRLGKATMEETKEKVEILGRLFQFFRQMDAAMTTDEHARLFQEAFIRGDYDLSETLASEKSEEQS